MEFVAAPLSAVYGIGNGRHLYIEEQLRVNRKSGRFGNYMGIGFHGRPQKQKEGYHSDAYGEEKSYRRVIPVDDWRLRTRS